MNLMVGASSISRSTSTDDTDANYLYKKYKFRLKLLYSETTVYSPTDTVKVMLSQVATYSLTVSLTALF